MTDIESRAPSFNGWIETGLDAKMQIVAEAMCCFEEQFDVELNPEECLSGKGDFHLHVVTDVQDVHCSMKDIATGERFLFIAGLGIWKLDTIERISQ